ncbi:glycoside hydrolase family 10 protein [Gemmatimonas phototrophica]|uniref:glycoside hydrolase family 10 protein n=1 Tax=Gemmatimonas phototrophica TaxID=1379270 RepID=UPI000AAFB90C|nr:family 10 glycosylhydrolase [Gemmatimonas phototrophica]
MPTDAPRDVVKTLSTNARRLLARGSLLLAMACGGDGPTEPVVTPPPPPPPTPVAFTVPAIAREFRGMWIATVANIDWPSRTGLTPAQQQAELGLLLDVAQQTGLNAVVLQVRAAGDAIYPSSLEPWSRIFNGTQGANPGYDPLAFAVQQARLRGIELHAWFNPFRAGNLRDTLTLAPQHLAVRRPDLVRKCGQLWFDPGEQAVQDHAIAVMRDVVTRYDVDAVHIDDFFYPYPDTCTNFPDSVTFRRYQQGGGALSLGDWRRDNVNRFVERMYTEVHDASPMARVGVSPFGIWRPGNPAGIVGLDAYTSIYADSRKWLQSGWVDYFAPQLYWSIASTGQSFPALLGWWAQQNTQRRHLWPGLASYRINTDPGPFSSAEIPSQVALIREAAAVAGGATGSILYNGSSVRTNRGGFASTLAGGLYAGGAIPPATTWLDATAPATPSLSVVPSGSTLSVTMSPNGSDTWWFLLRWRTTSGTWQQRLMPSTQRATDLPAANIDGVVLTAIDRAGNASGNAVVQR